MCMARTINLCNYYLQPIATSQKYDKQHQKKSRKQISPHFLWAWDWLQFSLPSLPSLNEKKKRKQEEEKKSMDQKKLVGLEKRGWVRKKILALLCNSFLFASQLVGPSTLILLFLVWALYILSISWFVGVFSVVDYKIIMLFMEAFSIQIYFGMKIQYISLGQEPQNE